MALGNFLGKLKGENKSAPKNFLALILTDEVVQAAVWNITGDKTEIVAIGTPVEWDGDTGTTGELITAVDATISNAVEGLEEEPTDFILGIPYGWTDKNGVLGVKREFINKIRSELELTAIGYVIITDSIVSYLKMQEGTPTTSILIQVSRDELTLVLVRLGRIEAIETIGRSDDVVEDVTEGIARFKAADNLPSRIILFNSMHNLDEIIQTLLSVNWQTGFNFLHVPKIESLGKDVAIRALTVAGGSEIASKLGIAAPSQSAVATPLSVPPEEPEIEESNVVAGDELEDEDDDDSEVIEDDEPSLLSADEIGFTSTPKSDPEDDDLPPQPKKDLPPVSRPKLSMPKISLPHLSFALPKLKFPSLGKSWYLLTATVLIIGGLIYYFTWVMPKAVVTVRVNPQTLEEKIDLTLSTVESSINFESKTVPAVLEKMSESGEKMLETTGKKIIGDPSKGEVTIYNRTISNKTFPKGTVISSGSLKFTLDSDTIVASKSAGSDYVDIPGKATVAVTASTIGEESNLSAGKEFTIASFGKDSYVAKNESAFTGGSSQEVRVVSKDDQSALAKELTAELLANLSLSATGNNQGEGVYLLKESAKTKDAVYSAKIGETAGSLSLTMGVEASVLRYQTNDVTTLVNSTIDQKVPAGFIRANLPSTVELEAEDVSEDESSVKGAASVKVSLLPILDPESTQKAISGKSASAIGTTLSTLIPGYLDATVTIKPTWIPARLKKLPRNSKNISLNLVATSP